MSELPPPPPAGSPRPVPSQGPSQGPSTTPPPPPPGAPATSTSPEDETATNGATQGPQTGSPPSTWPAAARHADAASTPDEPELAERLDDRERSLHPKVVLTWRIFGGIGLLFPLAGISIPSWFLLDTLAWLPAAIALVLLVLGVTWYPNARYRRWRWQLTERALEMRYGVVVHRHEAVPYFRVQQIDIERGPVDRLLGLATLQVTTASASGSGSLPGIAEGEAPLVRQELLLRAAEAIGHHGGDVNDAV